MMFFILASGDRLHLSALLISGMIFVSRKGAKTQRINIMLCTKVPIHPAFMQRPPVHRS
ncbi:hypothetical protein [Anabaena sp. CCY 9910]|uniref:hypothetical protein n=1 Tax=Anabaena sp. CCY 9910 TaxID=3103870 RepID=UPI0039E0BFDF